MLAFFFWVKVRFRADVTTSAFLKIFKIILTPNRRPNANALGYYQNVREENNIDPNRDFPCATQP